MSESRVWVDGEPSTTVDAFDRGLAFGDGLFETILIEQGHIPFLSFHLSRLEISCRKLNLSFDLTLCHHYLSLALDWVKLSTYLCFRLKIIVTRGSSNTGYAASDNASRYIMILTPFLQDLEHLHLKGVRTRVCEWRLSTQSRLAGLKHLNRLDQVMARREWASANIYEGLMLDQSGNFIEGTCSNLFVVRDGQLLTPLLNECGVEGIMKRVVISKLAPIVPVTCHQIRLNNLQDAQEVFITNALIGIVPVVSVDNNKWPVGQVTRQLQAVCEAYKEQVYEG